jgi:hypothetical protein
VNVLQETTYESEDASFYRKHGCLPGCAGPLALALVVLAVLLLDGAHKEQAFGDQILEGGIPSFTSTLAAEESLGDPPFLAPGAYVYLDRQPETFAWAEITDRDEGRVDRDNERRVTTTYSYRTNWLTSTPDSAQFHEPRGHDNPPTTQREESWARGRALGGRPIVGTVRTRGVPFVPKPAQLASGATLQGDFVYVGKGTLKSPRIGDVRVRYRALHGGEEATFFGDITGDALKPMPTTTQGVVGPGAALQAGSRRVAAERSFVDLGQDANTSKVFAYFLTFLGVHAALAALLMWTQRCASLVFRKGVYRALGLVTAVGSLGFLACLDFALRMGAPLEAVVFAAVLVTAVGFFAFGRWARAAREAVQDSFWLGLLLGVDDDD